MIITLKIRHIMILLVSCLTMFSGCSLDQSPSSRIFEQISPYDFEETMMNLDIAISEHNYRIIHRSNIGQAVRDRGEADYPLSTVISFCNITYAKEMMAINNSLINDMPCVITIREQQNHIIVGTRLMIENTDNHDQNQFAKKINTNLRSIVAATIE